MKKGYWFFVVTIALAIFTGLCWLDMRPGPTLHTAAANGNLELIREKLADGAHINALDRDGFSPLMRAVLAGHLEIMDLLLTSGADVNQPGEDGNTALYLAAAWTIPVRPKS